MGPPPDTPTPAPSAQASTSEHLNTAPPLIDCTLHTGRIIQADKATCDDFNSRQFDPYQSQQGSNNSSISKEEIEYMIQLDSAKQQNDEYQRNQELQEYDDCTAKAFNDFNSCDTSCYSEKSAGNDACFAAYSGANPLIENSESKLNQCFGDVDSIWNSCWDECNSKKSTALEQC